MTLRTDVETTVKVMAKSIRHGLLRMGVSPLWFVKIGLGAHYIRGGAIILLFLGLAFIGIWLLGSFIETLFFSGSSLASSSDPPSRGTLPQHPAPLSSRPYEDLRNLGLVIVGFFGLPFLVWRSWVAHKQVGIAEQGHITDRINAAVLALGTEKVTKLIQKKALYLKLEDGSWARDEDGDLVPELSAEGEPMFEFKGHERTEPNIEVRIGAIYSLERIAQDSLRDHVQIMEILCAYIRTNSPAHQASRSPHEISPYTNTYVAERRINIFGILEENALDRQRKWRAQLPKPRQDIQVALTVIGRRSAAQRAIEAEVDDEGIYRSFKLDFAGANLQTANFMSGNFARASFVGTRLDGAQFMDARLQGVEFQSSSMQGAAFNFATMEDSFIVDCDLSDALFKDARSLPKVVSHTSVFPVIGMELDYEHWELQV